MIFNVATAGATLLPLSVCNAPAGSELMKMPLAVTLTVTVQEPLIGIAPPVKVTVEPPAVAKTVPPTQVVAAPGGEAITTPFGKWSLSDSVRLATVPLRLVRVSVRVDIPPGVMVEGVKDLFSVGGVTTVKVATAGAVLLPSLVCKDPVTIVLV